MKRDAPFKPIGFAVAAIVAGLAPTPAEAGVAAPVARQRDTGPVEPAAPAEAEATASLKSAPVAALSSPSEWSQGDLFGV